MLTPELYRQQIERLENAYMYKINQGAIDLWIKELEEAGIDDRDLKDGIDYILNSPSKFTVRPHLGNLLEYCGNARQLRWEKQEAAKKAKGYVELSKADGVTEHGKRSLSLIKLLLKGWYEKDGKTIALTKRDKVDYMLKMDKYYPEHGWEDEAMGLRKEFNLR